MFHMTETSQAALAAAGSIVFLAGLSEGLGRQAVVLLINRISPARFLVNLLLSALIYSLSALLWATTLWSVAQTLFGATVPLSWALVAVSIAYLPLLLMALSLLPYIGTLIDALLHLSSLLISVAVISRVFQLGLWEALACNIVGWLALELLRAPLSEPLAAARRRLWALSTGRPERLGHGDLPMVITGYEPPAEDKS